MILRVHHNQGHWLAGFAGIWHMDEAAWLSGSSVRDSSGSGNNGSPEGDAKPTTTARVGAYAGTFDGNGDDIVIPAINLGGNDFSVGGWVNQRFDLKALSSLSWAFSQSSACARQTMRSPTLRSRVALPLAPPTACQRPSRKNTPPQA